MGGGFLKPRHWFSVTFFQKEAAHGIFDFFKRKGSAEDRQQQQKKEEEKAKEISKPFTGDGLCGAGGRSLTGSMTGRSLFEIVTRPQIIGTAEEKVLKKAMRRLTDPELLGRISVMKELALCFAQLAVPERQALLRSPWRASRNSDMIRSSNLSGPGSCAIRT